MNAKPCFPLSGLADQTTAMYGSAHGDRAAQSAIVPTVHLYLDTIPDNKSEDSVFRFSLMN